MALQLKKISVPLAPFTLEVDVEIRGRLTAIFGPSGAGKTTLLDLVAGLRPAQSAFIQLDARVLTDTSHGVFVPSRHRGIGYVPQDLALFPHLSVRQNLLYGQKSGQSANPALTLDRVVEVLEIQSLVQRRVTDLSGGEKQRVAIARALLSSPRLLLLDEPLASLDLPLRSRIIPYLTRIRDEFQVPMLYVTHDRSETLALADEMVVLINGKVEQSGPVQDLFNRPASPAVAGVLAVETIANGHIEKIENGLATVTVGPLTLEAVAPNLPAAARDVYVCIRAENVVILKGIDVANSARNHLPGIIRLLGNEGPLVRVELDCGFPLTALLTAQSCEEMKLAPGERVIAQLKAQHVHLIARWRQSSSTFSPATSQSQ
ncbi:MAG TPA: molybdenum ABC transporter ATP-binding protein [Alphaproteobacteria bacterium]|nr:molybdenum ABC transporter ATP-binding protein [Alphaproteobacteria bacterium]